MILLKNWSKTSSKTDNEKVNALTAGGEALDLRIFLGDWAEVSNCGGTMCDKTKMLFNGDNSPLITDHFEDKMRQKNPRNHKTSIKSK